MEGEVPNFSGETGGGLAPLRGSQAVCTCENELSRVLDESLELWPWQRVRYEPRTLADPFKAAEGSVEGLGRTQEIFSQAERLSGETIDFLRETIDLLIVTDQAVISLHSTAPEHLGRMFSMVRGVVVRWDGRPGNAFPSMEERPECLRE